MQSAISRIRQIRDRDKIVFKAQRTRSSRPLQIQMCKHPQRTARIRPNHCIALLVVKVGLL